MVSSSELEGPSANPTVFTPRRSVRLKSAPDRLQVDPSKKSYCQLVEEELKEPRSYADAISSPQQLEWTKAMEDELASLQEMGTWTLVPRETNMKVVKSKWVFRIKRGPTGKIDKFKARVVAVGCSQVQGVDYFETFSPVVKLTSLRILLALANEEGLFMRQLDVKTAYLHGKLEETVYMEQPPGSKDTSLVCKLHKSIYGLKQSGRTWYRTLDDVLRKQGYIRLESDRCVYVLRREKVKVILSVYVDDMIVFANTRQALKEAIDALGKFVELKDLGEPRYILGIEVNQDKDKRVLTLSQRKQIDELLKTFHMEDCAPVKTPMEPSHWKGLIQSTKQEQTEVPRPDVPYQSLLGHLMYLVQGTRPDIAFATNFLSQFNTSFTTEHWKMAKRVLRYLKGTRDVALSFTSLGKNVFGFSDASWNELSGGRSRSGYVFVLAGGAVAWKSSKQNIVALSTCEAEYVALAEATREGKWIKMFLHELDYDTYCSGGLLVNCDSQSAIKLIENPIHHQRSKHIALRYLYARNEIEEKEFKLQYVATDSMVADSLTKPVSSAQNAMCSNGFGLISNG